MDSDPLDYAMGKEHHHPILITIGGHGGRLEKERDYTEFMWA